MNNPLVSVLMTVYNREKYVGEAIESVLSQTYQNWELIITDDQSKDNSVSIIQSYVEKDARIHLYINEHNLGDYPNRNRAASLAKGKYLKYLDSDDLLYPWTLGCFVSMMERNPETKWGMLYDSDKVTINPFVLTPEESYHCNYFKTLIFHKGPLASIITKEAFDAVGGFSGKQHLGDYEMWHILGRKFPVLMIPIGMVWWRTHEGQQMSDNRSDPFVPFKYLVLRVELINHPECPLPIEERQLIIRRTNKQMARLIVKTILYWNISKAKQMMRACGFSLFDIIKNV